MAPGYPHYRLSLPCVAGLLVFASGCSSAVVVGSSFPRPLVEPLPVHMGVIIGDELRDFIHIEDIPQQSTWTIDLGDANAAMLEPLFAAMFRETSTVDDVPVSPSQSDTLDAVLRPILEKFEFDVPMGERDQFVEVWMQYKLALYEPGGNLIAEWPVTGYGKHELDGRSEDAVQEAAIVAMREVGATISTRFATQPDVSAWLEEKRNAASLASESRIN